MSETEYNVGKLIPLVLSGATDEERAESVCKLYGYKLHDVHDSWVECLSENGYNEVYMRNGVVYKIENVCSGGEQDIFTANRNEDGTIDYVTQFYNGGCGFDEALDEALKRMENKDGQLNRK